MILNLLFIFDKTKYEFNLNPDIDYDNIYERKINQISIMSLIKSPPPPPPPPLSSPLRCLLPFPILPSTVFSSPRFFSIWFFFFVLKKLKKDLEKRNGERRDIDGKKLISRGSKNLRF